MKTHVITLSKHFLKGHTKEGQPTNFKEAILNGTKIHTIRENFHYWARKIIEVQDGEAVLSIRQWSGKPYRSKQEEITYLTADDGVGFNMVLVSQYHGLKISIDDFTYFGQDVEHIAQNDGLFLDDFENWFFPTKSEAVLFSGILIYFNNFRY